MSNERPAQVETFREGLQAVATEAILERVASAFIARTFWSRLRWLFMGS
jgi:hypothetical protein